MDRVFIFGGEEYLVGDRLVLRGMDYYRVLVNKVTGNRIYLLCFPND